MKNSIKITQDAYDKNVLHMELGGTSGNPENPEKVVVINTLEDGEITRDRRRCALALNRNTPEKQGEVYNRKSGYDSFC